MKSRCYYSGNIGFKNYGGRGIKVCDDWKKSYEVFREWAEANGYQEGLEIDRRNNHGYYEPGNCRKVKSCAIGLRLADGWDAEAAITTPSKKGLPGVLRPGRGKKQVAFGESKILKEWANDARSLVGRVSLIRRMQKGWDLETALTTPGQPGVLF